MKQLFTPRLMGPEFQAEASREPRAHRRSGPDVGAGGAGPGGHRAVMLPRRGASRALLRGALTVEGPLLSRVDAEA